MANGMIMNSDLTKDREIDRLKAELASLQEKQHECKRIDEALWTVKEENTRLKELVAEAIEWLKIDKPRESNGMIAWLKKANEVLR